MWIGITSLSLLALAAYLAGANHIVHTRAGWRVYPKQSFTYAETWLDMRSIPMKELAVHPQVVHAMAKAGDLRLIAGGQVVELLGKDGERLANWVVELALQRAQASAIASLGASKH
jgi:hypothetical protein